MVNLRGKVCNDYRECLRQSESFAVLSNVLSSRGIVGLDVSDCSLPAIQFRSEIGMTEQNTNDSRGSVSRTDPAHYNQADTDSSGDTSTGQNTTVW